MHWGEICAIIGVLVAFTGFVYGLLRNFKTDICTRMDMTDARITSLEERMFYMATGKTLTEAILLEKMKRLGKDD